MKNNIQIDFLANHRQFVDAVARFWCLEWGSDKSEQGIEKTKERILHKLNTDKIPLILIAFDGDKCLGTVAIVEDDLEKRPDLTPWIASVYIEENHRGHGIAKLLVEAAMRKAKTLGLKIIYLHTETAHGLYEKMRRIKLSETTNDRSEPSTICFYKL
ncbi:MAG: GNAT family N-acetyltransferase [Candidatus Berkelbacteria bacterium]